MGGCSVCSAGGLRQTWCKIRKHGLHFSVRHQLKSRQTEDHVDGGGVATILSGHLCLLCSHDVIDGTIRIVSNHIMFSCLTIVYPCIPRFFCVAMLRIHRTSEVVKHCICLSSLTQQVCVAQKYLHFI